MKIIEINYIHNKKGQIFNISFQLFPLLNLFRCNCYTYKTDKVKDRFLYFPCL